MRSLATGGKVICGPVYVVSASSHNTNRVERANDSAASWPADFGAAQLVFAAASAGEAAGWEAALLAGGKTASVEQVRHPAGRGAARSRSR